MPYDGFAAAVLSGRGLLPALPFNQKLSNM